MGQLYNVYWYITETSEVSVRLDMRQLRDVMLLLSADIARYFSPTDFACIRNVPQLHAPVGSLDIFRRVWQQCALLCVVVEPQLRVFSVDDGIQLVQDCLVWSAVSAFVLGTRRPRKLSVKSATSPLSTSGTRLGRRTSSD